MYCTHFSRVTTSVFSRMLGVSLPLDNRLLLTFFVMHLVISKGANKISMFRISKKKNTLHGHEIARNTWVVF